MEASQGWGQDLADLRRRLGGAVAASHHLADWIRMQLGPERLLPDVLTLIEEISKAESIVNQLSDRLHRGPLDALVYGRPILREEFHLLVALGVLQGGSYTGDPYGDFQMTRYEDDEQQGYISLDEAPPQGTARIRIGPMPEGIAWQRLRPEQRDFFDRHMPDLAARFRRDAQRVPSERDPRRR